MAESNETAVVDTGLLDALGSALVVSDAAGRIFLWNHAAERLYGHPREQMLGANVMELLVRPQDHDLATEIMAQVLAGEPWSGVFPVRCAHGRVKTVRITDSPLLRDGELIGVVGLAEEVTEADAPADRPSPHGQADLDAALRELDGLRTAMRTRGTIEQAKGILMATHGVDADAAFAMLKRTSMDANRKLYDVARELIDETTQRTRDA